MLKSDIVTILKCELVNRDFHQALRSRIFWLHMCVRYRIHTRPKIAEDFTQKYYGDEGYDPFAEKLDLLPDEESTAIMLEFGKV
jgi:hypothetical protein